MIRLHLIANALLLWLAYYWLGIGESSIPQLVLSAVIALVLVCATLVVHGASYTDSTDVRTALRTAVSHLLPLFAVALAALLVYGLLSWWQGYSSGPAFKLASWMTLKSRKPVKPESVLRVFDFFLWIVRWILLPWTFVPLASALARDGWSGFAKQAWQRSRTYWILLPVLLLAALWLPLKILGWVPAFSSFSVQMISFGLRALIAYALFAGGLFALARATSGGSPRFSQSKTAASP